jgi:hypothetical protein
MSVQRDTITVCGTSMHGDEPEGFIEEGKVEVEPKCKRERQPVY